MRADAVRIRPWERGDLPLLERLLGDPDMTVYLGGPETSEQLLARHERYLTLQDSSDGVFAVEALPEDVAVGWVGYWEADRDGQRIWEMGWHVVPEAQGRGVATAAAMLALARVRAVDTHRFVHAFPDVANVASNAVCRKLGFELLGEVDIEYPPGRPMRANDWRLDLLGAR